MAHVLDDNIIGNENLWKKAFKNLLEKPTLSADDKFSLRLAYEGTFIQDTIRKLQTGTYTFQIPHKLEIQKIGSTKTRVVYVYPLLDRIVLNVLYQACAIVYGEHINPNVYSYKEHISTGYALKYLISHNDLRHKYAVKLDISSYFNSVSEDYLRAMLVKIFSNEPILLKTLLELHFKNKVERKGVIIDEYCSLTPGSPFSSYLANTSLYGIDCYCSTYKDITYARYSDDIIMFSNSKETLVEAINYIKTELNQMGLDINEKKYVYYDPDQTVTFLGLNLTYNEQNGNFDITVGDKTLTKLKHYIKHVCKHARYNVTKYKKSPKKEVAKAIYTLNKYFYLSFKNDMEKYGFCHYMFSNINGDKGLKELDYYLKDSLRYIMSGKHNKYNAKRISTQELQQLGLISFYQSYYLFKTDRDYYYDQLSKIQPVFLDKIQEPSLQQISHSTESNISW